MENVYLLRYEEGNDAGVVRVLKCLGVLHELTGKRTIRANPGDVTGVKEFDNEPDNRVLVETNSTSSVVRLVTGEDVYKTVVELVQTHRKQEQ